MVEFIVESCLDWYLIPGLMMNRKTQQTPALSDKDQEEKARKCEFVQGLLLSTFLNDDGL